MFGKDITVGGLEVPYSVGDDFFTISEPDLMARYVDHFCFGISGPEKVTGVLIQSSGIYIGNEDEEFIPLIEIFKTEAEAEEFIELLGADRLPFKEQDTIVTPRGSDFILGLSIDFDRRKLLVHTEKGFNFTMEEWGDTVRKA